MDFITLTAQDGHPFVIRLASIAAFGQQNNQERSWVILQGSNREILIRESIYYIAKMLGEQIEWEFK